MPNFRAGDFIRISGNQYFLERRLLGGYQFRTWVVARNGKEYVVKATDKQDGFLRELGAHAFLTNNKYPDRYYGQLISIDSDAVHQKSNGFGTGRYNAILLKFYPHDNLEEFVRTATPPQKRLIADKLTRRVLRLHQAGICHGDLRESNILVTHTRRGLGVRLIDFGLSSIATEANVKKENRKLRNIRARLA